MCTVGGRIGWIVTRSGTARRPSIPGTTTLAEVFSKVKFQYCIDNDDHEILMMADYKEVVKGYTRTDGEITEEQQRDLIKTLEKRVAAAET